MDEPFSALDAHLKNEARFLVRDLLLEKSIPSILVTHDHKDAEILAEKVVHLKNGKVNQIEIL
jgi:molybdate transport system ATP-binding protein